MNSRPKIIGHILIDRAQQRQIAHGATFSLPLAQFRETIKWAAHMGDFAWVKEPFVVATPTEAYVGGRRITAGAAVPGDVGDYHDAIPSEIKARPYAVTVHRTGEELRRSESRFTVEIVGFDRVANTIQFFAHRRQIDEFIATRKSVAA